ncbi:MAG: type II toxin-antitoxin system RelE/ParE family toxin [Methylococcaceae bacterium]|nr:MAG: type II toxin-antitoxin system RelE/ParE family toxin [Methylococcaceae bacterium]
MHYSIRFKPRAEKNLSSLSKADQLRILEKIEALQEGLVGDIKHLTSFTPEYRLRVGNFRVLFEVVDTTIIIYAIAHRRDAYRQGA